METYHSISSNKITAQNVEVDDINDVISAQINGGNLIGSIELSEDNLAINAGRKFDLETSSVLSIVVL